VCVAFNASATGTVGKHGQQAGMSFAPLPITFRPYFNRMSYFCPGVIAGSHKRLTRGTGQFTCSPGPAADQAV